MAAYRSLSADDCPPDQLVLARNATHALASLLLCADPQKIRVFALTPTKLASLLFVLGSQLDAALGQFEWEESDERQD